MKSIKHRYTKRGRAEWRKTNITLHLSAYLCMFTDAVSTMKSADLLLEQMKEEKWGCTSRTGTSCIYYIHVDYTYYEVHYTLVCTDSAVIQPQTNYISNVLQQCTQLTSYNCLSACVCMFIYRSSLATHHAHVISSA